MQNDKSNGVVLVVDFEDRFASAVADVLRLDGYSASCCRDAPLACAMLQKQQTDVLVVGDNLPYDGAAKLGGYIANLGMATRTVLINSMDLDGYAALKRFEPDGQISRPLDVAQFLSIVRTLAAPPAEKDGFGGRRRYTRDLPLEPAPPMRRLTTRQQEVLDCLLDGYSIRETATVLSLAEATVTQHRTAIYRLLNVRGAIDTIRMVRSRLTQRL